MSFLSQTHIYLLESRTKKNGQLYFSENFRPELSAAPRQMLMRLRRMLQPCAKENLGQVNRQLGILVEMQVPRCLACEATWPGWRAGLHLSFRCPLKLNTFDAFTFVEQGTLPALQATYRRLLQAILFRGRLSAIILTAPLHPQGAVDSQAGIRGASCPSSILQGYK